MLLIVVAHAKIHLKGVAVIADALAIVLIAHADATTAITEIFGFLTTKNKKDNFSLSFFIF